MAKHYKYGGSTAARTLACPAWRKLADKLPKEDTAGEAAQVGTALHACMEGYLIDETPVEQYVDQIVEGVHISPDLVADKLIPAAEATEELFDAYEVEDFISEHLMEMSDIEGGTGDIIACGPDHVIIGDYKFGESVVNVASNKQLLFYAMLAMQDKEVGDMFYREDGSEKKLVLSIIQPAYKAEHPLTVYETTLDEVQQFGEHWVRAVQVAERGEDETCPGAHCTFCPAMAICPSKTGKAALAQRIDTKDLTIPEEIDAAMLLADELEAWIKSVRKLAYQQAELGVSFTHFKLVDKRATRQWNDREAVVDKIKKMRKIPTAEAMPPQLLSPAQLEKLCKLKGVDFKDFSAYISNVSTGTTLVSRDDKRPEALAVGALAEMAKRLN